jgi:hypothetical protein
MQLNEKELTKMLNKEVRIETTRNSVFTGTLVDFDLDKVYLQKRVLNEPIFFKSQGIDKFTIKSIQIVKGQEKTQPTPQDSEIQRQNQKEEGFLQKYSK